MTDLIKRVAIAKHTLSLWEKNACCPEDLSVALSGLIESCAAIAELAGWNPIESAPKDGSRILLFRKGHIVAGYFNGNKYSKTVKPYWSHDNERIFGTLDARKCAPTHWMPLPTPPETADDQ